MFCVQSTMGVLCLMSGFMNALFMQGAIARTLRDRAPFYRETASGTYHSLVFPLANYFIELPITVPLSLLVSKSFR